MASQLRYPLFAHEVQLPPVRRLRAARPRRSWWQRFWDPHAMFELKITLLLSCFIIAAAMGGG